MIEPPMAVPDVANGREGGAGAGVKVGVYLFTTHGADESLPDCLDRHLAAVRRACALGFDSVAVGNSFLTHPFQGFQPIPLLGRLAADAGNMLVGAAVLLLPYYNPLMLADQVVTLDTITGGRLFLGVGVGFSPHAASAFGLSPAERMKRLVEYLDVLERLWAGDEVTAEGRFGSLVRARLGSRPVQRPRPPMYLGADADGSVRRAAAIADAWLVNPRAGLAEVRRQLAIYRAALAAARRPFPRIVPIRRDIFVARDAAEAYEAANRYPRLAATLYARGGANTSSMTRNLVVGQSADPLIVGTPSDCAAQLATYVEEIGNCHFLLRVGWPGMPAAQVLDSLSLIGEEIIPRLKV